MKKFVIIVVFLFASIAYAQENPVKIVFDVTSSDPATHKMAMRHVKFMADAYPNSEFELVGYSGSLDMFLAQKSAVREEMEALINKKNVSFKVCAATMKRYEATQDDLIQGVESVPDGILEIVTKQQQGWGYIKEANN